MTLKKHVYDMNKAGTFYERLLLGDIPTEEDKKKLAGIGESMVRSKHAKDLKAPHMRTNKNGKTFIAGKGMEKDDLKKSRTVGAKDKRKRRGKGHQAMREQLMSERQKHYDQMAKDKWYGPTKDGKPYEPRVKADEISSKLKQMAEKYKEEIKVKVHRSSKEEDAAIASYYAEKRASGDNYTGD